MNFFNRADSVIAFIPPWKTIALFALAASAVAACVIGYVLVYL